MTTYHTNHPSQCEPGCGIVRAIVKRWNVVIFIPGCEAFKKLRMSCRVQNTDWLRTEQGGRNKCFTYSDTKTSMHVNIISNCNDHESQLRNLQEISQNVVIEAKLLLQRKPSSFIEGNALNPLGIKKLKSPLFIFLSSLTKLRTAHFQ